MLALDLTQRVADVHLNDSATRESIRLDMKGLSSLLSLALHAGALAYAVAAAAVVPHVVSVRHAGRNSPPEGAGTTVSACDPPGTRDHDVGDRLPSRVDKSSYLRSKSCVLSQQQLEPQALLALRGGSGISSSGDDGVDTATAQGREHGGDIREVDEALYSRQLYVMGKSAMAKMSKADVLISGMRSACGFISIARNSSRRVACHLALKDVLFSTRKTSLLFVGTTQMFRERSSPCTAVRVRV